MSPEALELLRLSVSFAGGAVGAGVTNTALGKWFERQQRRETARQTRWLPLLDAARTLSNRLDDLQKKYREIPPKCEWMKRDGRMLPTWARDFHELYTLHGDTALIEDLEKLGVDPDQARKCEAAVHRTRIRMCHQLNYAASTLYVIARYLGYARRVRSELDSGKLKVKNSETASKLRNVLNRVRTELHGTSTSHPGSGILEEQQDLIGENVWSNPDNDVIGYREFQGRLLVTPGWEQFTGLFRFTVAIDLKLESEVELTKKALEELCSEMAGIAGKA